MKTGRFSAAGETYISSSLDSIPILDPTPWIDGEEAAFFQKKKGHGIPHHGSLARQGDGT